MSKPLPRTIYAASAMGLMFDVEQAKIWLHGRDQQIASLTAEVEELRTYRRHHAQPKGLRGAQCCDPALDGEIDALITERDQLITSLRDIKDQIEAMPQLKYWKSSVIEMIDKLLPVEPNPQSLSGSVAGESDSVGECGNSLDHDFVADSVHYKLCQICGRERYKHTQGDPGDWKEGSMTLRTFNIQATEVVSTPTGDGFIRCSLRLTVNEFGGVLSAIPFERGYVEGAPDAPREREKEQA